MLTFDLQNKRFNHRVAGACIHDGRVLLTQAEGEDFLILPGGRVEIGEDTRTAMKRELTEELGCEAEVGRLLWVVEGFFSISGRDYHEVAFFYECRIQDPSVLESSWTRNITDGGIAIEFGWFPLDGLGKVNLQPAFLKDVLADPPGGITHIIRRG